MPYKITRAFSYLKKTVALVNKSLGTLDEKADAIVLPQMMHCPAN